MKKMIFMAVFLLFNIAAYSQSKAVITFDKRVHDFGEILAGSGPATHTFTFTNEGDEPLLITNAKATCGCTVPKWTKDPVMPGEKGEVQVTFTTTRVASPKPFSKGINVMSNGNPKSLVLTIKGHVVAKLTPFSKGQLSSTSIDIGEYRKKSVSTSFEIMNEGDADMKIVEILAPDYVTVEPVCYTIVGGSKVNVNVEVNTKGKDVIEEDIIIKTDSDKTPELKITLLGNKK